MKTQDVLKLIEKDLYFPKDVAVVQTASGDFVGFMPVGHMRPCAEIRVKRLRKRINGLKQR